MAICHCSPTLARTCQAAPGQPAGPRHLPGDALDQQLVGVAAATVLRQRLGEHGDAGVADAQGLVAEGAALAHQEAGRHQLDLDRVLAGPAGRAVDIAQAPPVNDADRDQRHRGKRRAVGHGKTNFRTAHLTKIQRTGRLRR
jgi:hypothetical protein